MPPTLSPSLSSAFFPSLPTNLSPTVSPNLSPIHCVSALFVGLSATLSLTVYPLLFSIWSPLCLPLCLSLCFKLCLPLYTPVSLSLCFKLCLPLCLRLCHPCRLPLVSHFVSSVSPALPPCRPFVSHFVQTFQLASMFMGRIFDSWKQYGRQSGRHGGRQNGRQRSLRQSEGQSAGHRRRQDLFHLELGTATAVGLQSWVNFPFFHLLDALSALVFPCLPACLSCSLCCLFFGSLFPLIPFVGCCVHLSEALSPLSPLLFCLPCFSSCPPFLFPFVGCCVRLSDTLFPWSLFLFPRVGGNVLSEALSPCLSPFLFPHCWMLCPDPEALSGHVSLVLLCCVPEALSPSSPFLFSLLLPYAGCCGCLLEALSPFLSPFLSRFWTPFVGCCVHLCDALFPSCARFCFPSIFPLLDAASASRGLVSLVSLLVSSLASFCWMLSAFPRPRLPCLLWCPLSPQLSPLSLFFPFFCWMPCPPFRGLVSLLVLLFSLRVVLLVSLCWMLCPPSRGLPSCPFFLVSLLCFLFVLLSCQCRSMCLSMLCNNTICIQQMFGVYGGVIFRFFPDVERMFFHHRWHARGLTSSLLDCSTSRLCTVDGRENTLEGANQCN